MSTVTALTTAAAALIRRRAPVRAPVAAVVLGSGLGGLARRIQSAVHMPYAEVPGFVAPGVAGHAGAVIHGMLGNREVIALAGRFHMYEGHDAQLSALPVRVMSALGVPILVLSNAAGGISRHFKPGTLMAIADQLNLTWRNPLVGVLEPGDTRFPDMSEPFDQELRRRLHLVATRLGVALQDGVYAGLQGPTYETPAEVRMLERLGADAVGMSTVAEVIVARARGMRVLGVSCITNPAAGMTHEPINHDDVILVTARAAQAFESLIETWVSELPESTA